VPSSNQRRIFLRTDHSDRLWLEREPLDHEVNRIATLDLRAATDLSSPTADGFSHFAPLRPVPAGAGRLVLPIVGRHRHLAHYLGAREDERFFQRSHPLPVRPAVVRDAMSAMESVPKGLRVVLAQLLRDEGVELQGVDDGAA
jgi:hypothetical protein